MNLTELQALEERYLMRTYRRAPVEFVRGEGALLWDAEGKEYLDFLTGISVCSVGHCHPAVVEAVREQAGRLVHTSNLFYTEPMVRLAERLGRVEPRRPRLLLQLRHRGQRVRDQDRPQARPRPRHRGAGDRQLRARLPRPHLRLAGGDAGAGPQRGPGADARRLPLGAAERRRRPARGGRRAHRGGPDRADPGRERRLSRHRGGALRRPRSMRLGGRAADLRRDPDRDGEDRLALGLRADPGATRPADQRQGARRRLPDRRLRLDAGGRRGARARRPRLHLRRRPGRRRRGAGGPRCRRRPGAAARGPRAGDDAWAMPCSPSTGFARCAAAG